MFSSRRLPWPSLRRGWGLVRRRSRSRAAMDMALILLPIPFPFHFPLPSSVCGFSTSFLLSAAYNLCTTLSFHEPLDPAILEKSLAEIVRRHEILRTTFDAIDGQGVQIIASPSSPALTVIDLRHKPEGEAQADNGTNDETNNTPINGTTDEAINETASKLIKADASTPFDLAGGPLLRATLLRISDSDQILVLTMHHIVADKSSLGILKRELELCWQLTGMASLRRCRNCRSSMQTSPAGSEVCCKEAI